VLPVPAAPPPPEAGEVEPAPLARGGPQHSTFNISSSHGLKAWAIVPGLRSDLDGLAIDVALKKADTTIACEICITTDDVQELGNAKNAWPPDINMS